MSGERLSGLITEVFPKHKKPQGRLRVLTPLELRGQHVRFFYTDVDLARDDLQYLEPGTIMDFIVEARKKKNDDNSPLTQRALQVKPKDVAEYQGSVVRGPQPRHSGHGFVVSLDLTRTHVKVSVESYNQLQLEQPPLPGDSCTVRMAWSEILLSAKENRIPLADIVTFIRRPPRVSVGTTSLERNEHYGLSVEEIESDTTKGQLSLSMTALLTEARVQTWSPYPYTMQGFKRNSQPKGYLGKRRKIPHAEQSIETANVYSSMFAGTIKAPCQHFVLPLTVYQVQEMHRPTGHISLANACPAPIGSASLSAMTIFSYKHPVIPPTCQAAQENFFNAFNVYFTQGYIS